MSSCVFVSRCPNPIDQTVKMEGNGQGTTNFFSFNIFQFSGSSGDVYLHCKLELCSKQGNSCAQVSRVGGAKTSWDKASKHHLGIHSA